MGIAKTTGRNTSVLGMLSQKEPMAGMEGLWYVSWPHPTALPGSKKVGDKQGKIQQEDVRRNPTLAYLSCDV